MDNPTLKVSFVDSIVGSKSIESRETKKLAFFSCHELTGPERTSSVPFSDSGDGRDTSLPRDVTPKKANLDERKGIVVRRRAASATSPAPLIPFAGVISGKKSCRVFFCFLATIQASGGAAGGALLQ